MSEEELGPPSDEAAAEVAPEPSIKLDEEVINPESSLKKENNKSSRYQSRIVPPSKVQHESKVTPPREGTLPSSSGEMGIYERSMRQLEAKERKLERTKKEMMKDYTFTPETKKFSPTSKNGRNGVSVRLYTESKKSTPKQSNGRRSRGTQKKSPTSISSGGTKSTSSRIDQLYQEGLKKAQNRPLTDKQEEQARIRRKEEKELEKCTFRPNMDWRKKKADVSNGKCSPHQASTSPRLSTGDGSPPVDIVTTRVISTSDMRHSTAAKYSLVSPLREPDVANRASIPTGIESVGEDTEYGSI